MTIRIAALLLLTVLLAPRVVRADPLDDEIARLLSADTLRLAGEVAQRGFERFRRSVTLGPTLSIAPAMTLDDERERDVQIAGGVALLRYRIPTVDRIQDILLSNVKTAVIAQLRAAADRGEVLSEADRRRIVLETWTGIKDELVSKVQPRHLEKPQFALAGEVAYLTGDGAWDVRALVGIGIVRVFAAVGLALQYESDPRLLIPVELSLPVLLSDGLRSPVAQIFVRADFAVLGDHQLDRAFVGVRFALDVL
jgi:hypothetical protein